MNDNYLMINGVRYPVINSYVEVESRDEGRKRWGIVTEGEEHPAPQPVAPADATPTPALFATCTPNSMPQAGHVEFGYELNVMDDQLELLATLDLPDWHKFRPASAGHRLIEMGYMIHPDARNGERVNGWSEVPPFGSWMARVVRLDETGRPTEQPAEATTFRPSGFLQALKDVTDQTADVNPAHDPITPEERAQGAQWIERPSGPPIRVDGPGCTPYTVINMPTEAELADKIFGPGTAEQLEKRNTPEDNVSLTEEQAMLRVREVWPEAEGFLPHTRGWTYRVGGGYAYVTKGGEVARDPQGTRNAAVTFMGRRTPPASTQ